MWKRVSVSIVFLSLGVLSVTAHLAGCGSGSGPETGGTGGNGTGGTGGKASGSGGGGTSGGGGATGGAGGTSTAGTGGSAAGGGGGTQAAGTGGGAGGGADGTSTGGSAGGRAGGGAGGTSTGGSAGGRAGSGAGGTSTGGSAGGRAGGGAGGTSTGGAAVGGTGGRATGGGGVGGGAAGGPGTTPANLIVNGDAEAAVGSTDGTPVPTPGWIVAGEATAIMYGAAGGYPTTADPGPGTRGNNFLAGGVNDVASSLTQAINLTVYATPIDGNRATFTLMGFLGGYQAQGDSAAVTATFYASADTTGAVVGRATTIGPVTLADRAGATGLFVRAAPGNVPVRARSVKIAVDMTRLSGLVNDGYVDNLSFVVMTR